mgnify:CR=1 FL=1
MREPKYDSPLNNIKIASPCSADWSAMTGDERKRFCGDCKLHVYNLSGMTKYDAENLLRNNEGGLCVRYFQRADGTVMTSDCPVGWARIKQRLTLAATAAGSLAMLLLSVVFHFAMFGKRGDIVRRIPIIPLATPSPKPPVLMGAIAPDPRPKPSPSPTKPTMGKVAIPKERPERPIDPIDRPPAS